MQAARIEKTEQRITNTHTCVLRVPVPEAQSTGRNARVEAQP
jgi:hypothetical protein